MFEYYNNESLRKSVIAFGSLFNGIYISRTNSDDTEVSRIRVPLSYGPKEKFLRRLEEQSGISDSTKVEITLPRMSYEIASIQYDPGRHLNKLNKRLRLVDGEDNTINSYQEVPYNIGFTLYVYARNMDDNLQIVEQVLPYFSPEFIVSLKLNNLDVILDVPIVLNNTAIQEVYEGNFMDRRLIASSMSFTAKTRVYSKLTNETPIMDSRINIDSFSGDDGDVANSNRESSVNATGGTGGTGDTGGWNENDSVVNHEL